MARSNYARDTLASAYGAQAAWLSFHSADPGLTGASETANGRQQITWTLTPTGRLDAIVTTTLVASVTHVGFWTAETGGTYVDSMAAVAATGGPHSFILSYQQP